MHARVSYLRLPLTAPSYTFWRTLCRSVLSVRLHTRELLRWEGIRLQANPPVCNCCWREVTRQNLGCATVVGEAPHPGRFEFIECTMCTPVRDRSPEVTLFWARHQR